MPLPSQRRQITEKKQRKDSVERVAEQSNPVVFYRGRDVSTGNDLIEHNGEIIPAFITGNAQPVYGAALIKLDSDIDNLPLVLGPSQVEQDRRLVTVPAQPVEYAAAVLFTKSLPEPSDIVNVSMGNAPSTFTAWTLTFPNGVVVTTLRNTGSNERILVQTSYSASGTGGTTEGTIEAYGGPSTGFDSRTGFSFVVGIPYDAYVDGYFAPMTVTTTVSHSSNLGIVEDTIVSPRGMTSSANQIIPGGSGSVVFTTLPEARGGSVIVEGTTFLPFEGRPDEPEVIIRSFSVNVTISGTLAIGQSIDELWLGGDRTPIFLKSLTFDNALPSAVRLQATLEPNDPAQSSQSNEISGGNPFDDGGQLNLTNFPGTPEESLSRVDYDLSATSTTFQLTGQGRTDVVATSEGRPVTWSTSAEVDLLEIETGTTLFTGFVQVEIEGFDANATTDLASLSFSFPGSPVWELVHQNGVTTYSNPGVFFSVPVVSVGATTIRLAASISRTAGSNTFIQIRASYRLRNQDDSLQYLVANRSAAYVYARDAANAYYFQLDLDSNITETQDAAIVLNPQDWKQTLASPTPIPDDPNPCRQFYRFDSSANLQGSRLLDILFGDIAALAEGGSLTNVPIQDSPAIVDGSQCNTGSPLPDREIEEIQAITTGFENFLINIISIAVYRR